MKNSPNRLLGFVFGIVYILVGLIGFLYTNGVAFFSTVVADNKVLGLFAVNPLHNIVHLAVGLVLTLAAVRGVRTAKALNITVGTVYLLLGVVGLFILNSSVNILALNGADNVLHFGTAILLLIVGLATDRTHVDDNDAVAARVARA